MPDTAAKTQRLMPFHALGACFEPHDFRYRQLTGRWIKGVDIGQGHLPGRPCHDAAIGDDDIRIGEGLTDVHDVEGRDAPVAGRRDL